MVLQKRLYYGFNGYQAPAMPRGSRSARGKRSIRRNVEGNPMCAFELLATVAGKLLLEKEAPILLKPSAEESKPSVVKTPVKQEQQHEEKPFKVEPCDQGSCDEGTLASKVHCQKLSQKFALRECSQASSSITLQPASFVVKSEASGAVSVTDANKGDIRSSFGTVGGKCCTKIRSPCSAESHAAKVEDGITVPKGTELPRTGEGNFPDLLCSEDPMDLDFKPPTLVSSDSSVELPPHGNHIPRSSSFPNCRGKIELLDRDDDENSSRCTLPGTATLKASRPQRIGDRRIRKLLASRFWKVGPTLLKDDFSHNGAEVKPIFRSRRMCYTRQRTQRSSFKRRKLFDQSSISISCGEIANEVLSKSPEKGKGEVDGSAATLHGAKGISSSITDQSSPKSDDYQVKFSIKSFKMPELFIEMPETATVGALKRTVVETMTAILRNGLRVGVILQGKKVRDDSKTLLQAGISHGAKLDSLGFTLEPNLPQAPEQLTSHGDPALLDQCDSSKPLSWLPAVPASDLGLADAIPDTVVPQVAALENNMMNDNNSAAPSDTSLLDNATPNSKALVVVPAMSMEALAVVPLQRKSTRSELAQRRIRRPFSVAEVEALVQAVEKLGTGRWRDVKIRAFDNAKHRTYVDLKDKWKTLVHTARISPQQRRGEPVPQELLDRVLSAHAYWSQQQAKQQPEQQCLL